MTDTTTITDKTGAALVAVEKGTIAFGDFLRAVARLEPTSAPSVVDLPKHIVLTPAQLTALSELESIHASTPIVTDRSALTADEIALLLKERGVLDDVEAAIKAIKDNQRAMIFNHLDVTIEEKLTVAELTQLDTDDKGHYAVAGEVRSPGAAKRFTRELRQGSPTLTADDLAGVIGAPGVDFTKDDYLACTTQVRVLDEAKVLLHIRKRPAIITALAKATQIGKTSTSLYARKA